MDEQGSGSAQAAFGARCALHPMEPALAVCERCGNYMCGACTEGASSALCPPCRERTGAGAFPFDRANFDLGAVLNLCIARFKEQWVVLLLAVVILMFVSIGFGVVDASLQQALQSLAPGRKGASFAISGVVNLLSWLAQTGLQLGVWGIEFKVLRGERADLGDLFAQLSRLPAAFAQVLVLALPLGVLIGVPAGVVFVTGYRPESWAALIPFVGLATLLLIPLLFYVGLGLFFMTAELVMDPDVGPLAAMGRSWRIASGKRLWLLALMFLLIALSFAGLLACCVGIVPASAFSGLCVAGVYLALRNGAEL